MGIANSGSGAGDGSLTFRFSVYSDEISGESCLKMLSLVSCMLLFY